jgi:hypothetical protein
MPARAAYIPDGEADPGPMPAQNVIMLQCPFCVIFYVARGDGPEGGVKIVPFFFNGL